MTRAVIVPAQAEHVAPIVANARPADVTELWDGWRATPQVCMESGLALSLRCWTALLDGVPVAMFGVNAVSLLRGIGVPWLVGTAALDRRGAQKEVLRISPAYVDAMTDLLPFLHNVVDARNLAAQRWLEWLGFEIGEAMPYGPDGRPFLYFSKGHLRG